VKGFVVITDSTVAMLYAKEVGNFNAPVIVVETGEKSKSLATAETIFSQMVQMGCDRHTTVIGFGGGMICDLAGFVASTFCRGVSLILVPTTLLAMVDAAIGGKTAVNLPCGKNLVGSFYFPERILLHVPFLNTLPDEQWENGIVEILKIGLVADGDLFYRFSEWSMQTLIERAIEAKRRIIAQDPYESGKRALLNFGHTIGHALETLSGYTLAHGRAVATGIVLEARLSHVLGHLSAAELCLIEARFPFSCFSFSVGEIIEQLARDKKSKQGVPHFVLLKGIGEPYVAGGCFCHPVATSLLMQEIFRAESVKLEK